MLPGVEPFSTPRKTARLWSASPCPEMQKSLRKPSPPRLAITSAISSIITSGRTLKEAGKLADTWFTPQ